MGQGGADNVSRGKVKETTEFKQKKKTCAFTPVFYDITTTSINETEGAMIVQYLRVFID